MRPALLELAVLIAIGALAVGAPARAQDAGTADAGTADAGTPENKLPEAEPISFKAAIEKAEVTIGEPFAMTIEIRHAKEETYRFPTHFEGKEFSIRERKTELTGEGPVITRHRLMLQAFDVGDREIPAIRLEVETPGGPRQLELPPLKLKVNGVIDPAQGEPQMKEDGRPLPTKYKKIWWPIFALLGIVAGILLALYVRRRMRRPPAPIPVKPRATPEAEAMARLDALEQAQLVRDGLKQELHFRLSEILREYLGRRYVFDALEFTSDELLGDLRSRATPGLDFDALSSHLRASDLVKFARVEATDGECKTAMEFARQLVLRTTPPPLTNKEVA